MRIYAVLQSIFDCAKARGGLSKKAKWRLRLPLYPTPTELYEYVSHKQLLTPRGPREAALL